LRRTRQSRCPYYIRQGAPWEMKGVMGNWEDMGKGGRWMPHHPRARLSHCPYYTRIGGTDQAKGERTGWGGTGKAEPLPVLYRSSWPTAALEVEVFEEFERVVTDVETFDAEFLLIADNMVVVTAVPDGTGIDLGSVDGFEMLDPVMGDQRFVGTNDITKLDRFFDVAL
jgi:hypothetical protein